MIRYSIDVSNGFLSYFLQARSCIYDTIFNEEFLCFRVLLLADMLPNWNTRVQLPVAETEKETPSDEGYINANYIRDTLGNNQYIATQAPMANTFADFWYAFYVHMGMYVYLCV